MERRNRLSDIARLAAWYDGVSDLDLHGPTIPSHLKHFAFNVQLIAGPRGRGLERAEEAQVHPPTLAGHTPDPVAALIPSGWLGLK